MRNYLLAYLNNRPLFYFLIRPKEANLFHSLLPFKGPTLDFGCGDGFFAKVTFEDFGKIDIGLDIDEEKLKEAKEEKIYKRLILYKGDRLPFKSKSFLTVVSNCVLEHLPNLDESLSEIYRVLKPKGKLICTVMTNKWEDYLFGGLVFGSFYKMWMRKKQKHFNLYSEEIWKKHFEENGFKVIKVVGYMDKKASGFLDIFHYISFGSLVTKKLFNKWVLFPKIYNLFPTNLILRMSTPSKVSIKESSTLFYVLEKFEN